MSFTQYEAGAQIQVSYQETIDHVGCYQFALDTTGTDTNFVPLAQVVDPAGTPANTIRTQTLQLPPGVTCERCTLQIRQLMKTQQDPMCAPDANPNGANTSTYYSCADIRIGNFPDAAPSMPVPDAGTVDPTGEDPPGSEESPFNPQSSSGGRNLRAGAGDDGCSVGWGATTGIPAIAAVGFGVLMMLRRRRRR
jgi:hypothetical protein